ncbi:MAG: hypothetical protein QF775_03680, partial [archaeon]|nr:hypothetical protein [archaeon]
KSTKKAVSKAKKPVAKKKNTTEPKLVGRVSHYFDQIKVAAVKLTAPVKKGDTLIFEGGDTLFSQKIAGMEVEHKKMAAAKKGHEIGMKVSKKVREGYRVFKK